MPTVHHSPEAAARQHLRLVQQAEPWPMNYGQIRAYGAGYTDGKDDGNATGYASGIKRGRMEGAAGAIVLALVAALCWWLISAGVR